MRERQQDGDRREEKGPPHQELDLVDVREAAGLGALPDPLLQPHGRRRLGQQVGLGRAEHDVGAFQLWLGEEARGGGREGSVEVRDVDEEEDDCGRTRGAGRRGLKGAWVQHTTLGGCVTQKQQGEGRPEAAAA